MKRAGKEPLGFAEFVRMTETKAPPASAPASPLLPAFEVPIGVPPANEGLYRAAIGKGPAASTSEPIMNAIEEPAAAAYDQSLHTTTPFKPYPVETDQRAKTIFVAPMNSSLFMVGEMDMTTNQVRNLINTTTMPEAEAFAAGYRAALRDARA